jgi:hypothetical protein
MHKGTDLSPYAYFIMNDLYGLEKMSKNKSRFQLTDI